MNEFNISQENWDKIIDYARIAYDKHRAEIGGMAVMMQDKDGDWHAERPVILKQEISMSNTSIDKDELAKYYTKEAMYMEKEFPGVNYRFLWWHSHHTMSAFWSGTDHKAIEEFSDGDMSFALVVNLKEEYKFRISLWEPIKVAQDVTLNIIDKEPAKLNPDMIKEVKKLCEKETPVTYVNNWTTRNRHQGYLWGEVVDEPQDEQEMLLHEVGFDQNLEKVVEDLDKVYDKFVEGVFDADTFIKSLNKLNKSLAKMKSQWIIAVPSKANAYTEVLAMQSYELIKLKEGLK